MLSRTLSPLTIGILFLLPLFKETGAKNSTQFTGVVQNLSVDVIQDDGQSENETYRSLRLNISWSRPNGNRPPTSYSVTVTGLPTNNNATECPEESIFYTSPDATIFNVMLPQKYDFIDMSEMHILPGCSYKVQVYANPRMRPSGDAPEIVYRVPDCVAATCNCADAKSKLPIPKVKLVQTDDSFSIRWNTSGHGTNVQFYVISIGVPLLLSNNRIPVYNTTKIGRVPAPKNTFTFPLQFNESHVEVKSGFKISVTAMDYQGCLGLEGSLVIPSTALDLKSSDTFWFVSGGILFICILFGITGFIAVQSKIKYDAYWRSRSIRVRAISKCKSPWVDSILQRENVLYVKYDPEVEHARETDRLELSYKNLRLIRELGKGQFGKVYLGRLCDGEDTLVAVKTSQCSDMTDEFETRKQFMEEIDIMKFAGHHPHLVRLIGYCSETDKPVCIILEYMQGGDLLKYLHSKRKISRRPSTNGGQSTSGRSSRPSFSETVYTTLSYGSPSNSVCGTVSGIVYSTSEQTMKYVNMPDPGFNEFHGNISRKQFLSFASDIASGMRFLEARGITHRDLAARNILMDENLMLKISDFGLSRNGVYVINTKGSKTRHLPIRWMSPEALKDRAFSSKSDVWAFAIVLWEIGTLGAFPYPSVRDEHLLRYIIRDGGRLEQPESISTDLYQLMQHCWAPEPEDRPNFEEVFVKLRALTESIVRLTTANNPCYALT